MSTILVTREGMEIISMCKKCRHFHRYRTQPIVGFNYGEKGDKMKIGSRHSFYRRCLVSGAPLFGLGQKVIVDCNRFERKEVKKK